MRATKCHGEEIVLRHQELTERVIGLAIEVHRRTGPGLLESVYAACRCFELEQAGIPLSRQVSIPVTYKGMSIPSPYGGGIRIKKRPGISRPFCFGERKADYSAASSAG